MVDLGRSIAPEAITVLPAQVHVDAEHRVSPGEQLLPESPRGWCACCLRSFGVDQH